MADPTCSLFVLFSIEEKKGEGIWGGMNFLCLALRERRGLATQGKNGRPLFSPWKRKKSDFVVCVFNCLWLFVRAMRGEISLRNSLISLGIVRGKARTLHINNFWSLDVCFCVATYFISEKCFFLAQGIQKMNKISLASWQCAAIRRRSATSTIVVCKTFIRPRIPTVVKHP